MSLLSFLNNILSKTEHKVAQVARPVVRQVQQDIHPSVAAAHAILNQVQKHAAPPRLNISQHIKDIGNSHLQGLEQLTGKKNVTVKNIVTHAPVVGDAIKFAQQQNNNPSVHVGQFVKGIAKTGAKTAPYVAPELKAVKAATVPGKVGAKFINNALPAALTSVGADLATGNHNVSKIVQDAAGAAAFNGAASAALPALRAAKGEVKAGLPQLKNQNGYLAGPSAASFNKADSKGKTFKWVDGTKRFEQSDKGGQILDKGVTKLQQGQAVDLGDVIKHKQLKKDYPTLFGGGTGGIKVAVDPKTPHRAYYNPETNVIHLHPQTLTQLKGQSGRSILVHELQHAIDKHEGLVRGASPEAVQASLQHPEATKAQNALKGYEQAVNDLKASVKRGGMTKEQFDASPIVQAYKEAQAATRQHPGAAPGEVYDAYNRTPSEMTANAAETRSYMSQRQLENTPIGQQPNPYRLPGDFEGGDVAKMNAPKREPQTLNTERLNISEEAKGEVNALSAPEDVSRLSNKDVEQFSKEVGIDTKTHTIDEQKNIIARQLNLRKDITTMTNRADELLAQGDLSGRTQLLKEIAAMGRASTEQGTSIARQLQARRIIANELDTPLQRVFKLLDNAGINPDVAAKKFADVDFNDANAVVKAYRELVPPKASEWLDTVRYNSMLSSPLTQINNFFPNLESTAIITPIEKTLTGALDAVKSLITGQPRQHVAGEGMAYAKGYFSSLDEAKKRFSTSMSGKAEATNLDTKGHVPMYAHGQNKTYDVLSFPMRLMEAMDGFFTGLTEGGVTNALEHRASKGITVKNIQNTAVAESAYRLYRQELGDKSQGKFLQALDIPAQKLMELRNSKNPYVSYPAKFTVPFVRTTMNIFKQGFEYSPAGVLTLHGSPNKTEQLSKMLLGTAVVGAAGALLGQSRLTWSLPTNQKQKEAFLAAGMQPYSIKIGNKWVSFQKLPPAISFNLALVAALDDSIKNAKTDQGAADNALTAIAKYGQFMSDQSYTKSAGNFLKAVQGDPQATTQLLSGYPQQVIPFRAFSNWIANATDNTQRKVNKDAPIWKQQVEALEQVIPGLRRNTTAVTGPEGTPIPTQHPIINAVSPVKVSSEDPIGADYYGMLKQKSLDASNKRVATEESKKAGVDTKVQSRVDTAKKGLATGISKGSSDAILSYAKLDSKGKEAFNNDPKKKYALDLAKYENDVKAGKLNGVEQQSKKKSLAKQGITSQYSEEVVDFYNLSNVDKAAYFKQDPAKAKTLYDQAKDLSSKLASSGVAAKKVSTAVKAKLGGSTRAKIKKPPKLAIKQVHISLKSPKIKASNAKGPGYSKARNVATKTGKSARITA